MRGGDLRYRTAIAWFLPLSLSAKASLHVPSSNAQLPIRAMRPQPEMTLAL